MQDSTGSCIDIMGTDIYALVNDRIRESAAKLSAPYDVGSAPPTPVRLNQCFFRIAFSIAHVLTRG